MKLEFPIKHIEDNLVFGKDGTVWAYYFVSGFDYDFLDVEEKMIPFQRQISFLTNIGLDLDYQITPNPTDITNIIDRTILDMLEKEYELKENGISIMEQTKIALDGEQKENETTEYHHYIGIQLDPEKNKYVSSNAGIKAFATIKKFFEGLNSPIYTAVGLEPEDLLESDIKAFKDQAKVIESTLGSSFSSTVEPVTTEELVYMIEKTYSTRNNNSDIDIRKGFRSGTTVVGLDEQGKEHTAIRHNRKDFLDLQDTNIKELDAKTLLLSRITEDQNTEELYVQYLTVSEMDDVQYHPGSEWLYRIQLALPFPISVSIRAKHQPNDMVKKRLSNVKLEFQDQRKEATQGGQSMDLSVEESEQGAIQMEKYFQQTGFPAFSCSFIFKVTATNQEELKSRVNQLRNELSKYGVKVISPYGEQLRLLQDTIPSSRQDHNDYQIEVAPNLLAGIMFGATTNIGDNRGFYIGHTSKFAKPVFIQPDLAGKAYSDLRNVVDSIAVMVAGMTGKGKSFFMNLFVYLSTLTGSKALVIDPKGDRTGWIDGLPYIPKEYIEVWTLGSSEDDAGSLDPFRTSTSLQEAKDITMDVLSYLTNTDIEDIAYNILSEAVEKVSVLKDPCIGAILTYLKEQYENEKGNMSNARYDELEKLIDALETLKRNQLSILLFGEVGQDYKVLKHTKPIQVLMIQNLNLPSSEVKKLRTIHKISEAIMISITAWTKQYMYNSDRSVHKIILQDEASSIERNPMGSELMDTIVRQGRYWNTTLLKGSQNASDHGQDVANMGMKFSFGLRKTSEAKEMLDYLNLPQTNANIETLKNLDRGEALFQDIYGRSAVIRINPVFKDLLDAFDSSTATEEEREKEKDREKIPS